jgi:ubiquinone/menaquinone biosynthesis C-methylase UbiE
MSLSSIKKLWTGIFPKQETDSRSAYNLWAADYDHQPGNLMLDLDELVFGELLKGVEVAGKEIADIGCGTGRHWSKIMAKQPGRMIGYDVSEGMLEKLQQKFPSAETYLLGKDNTISLGSGSCDLVCSTLTVAHIDNIGSALSEWTRIIKDQGDMLVTDYHPAVLEKGGKRTFHHNGKLVAVKNYIHTIDHIRTIAKQLQLKEVCFIEKIVDESVKQYYENKNALAVYEAYKGLPVIYGIHFKKDR